LEADDTDGENPEIDKLQAKIDKIEERPRSWQPDTLAIAGAIVTIGFNGKPEIVRGYVKPEDAPKQPKKKLATNGSGDPIEEPASSLSASLVQDLTTHRTAALSAVLATKPEVALAALVEALAGQAFYQGYGHNTSVKIRLDEATLQSVEGSKAHAALMKAHEKWLAKLPGKEEELWDWCQKQKQPVVRLPFHRRDCDEERQHRTRSFQTRERTGEGRSQITLNVDIGAIRGKDRGTKLVSEFTHNRGILFIVFADEKNVGRWHTPRLVIVGKSLQDSVHRLELYKRADHRFQTPQIMGYLSNPHCTFLYSGIRKCTVLRPCSRQFRSLCRAPALLPGCPC
jgi:hypothetical protein